MKRQEASGVPLGADIELLMHNTAGDKLLDSTTVKFPK